MERNESEKIIIVEGQEQPFCIASLYQCHGHNSFFLIILHAITVKFIQKSVFSSIVCLLQ